MMREESNAIGRLTALWALSEAGLGGVFHAIKSPFAGTIIGAASVMIICMIAHCAEKKWTTILRSATIVLMIKVAVSPHSPLTAYVALSFQALAGATLFALVTHFRTAALCLGIVSLLESSLQKVLLLTFLYGTSMWESLNVFFIYVTHQLGITSATPPSGFSFWLIMGYLSIYGIVGVIAGVLGGILPQAVARALEARPCEFNARYRMTYLAPRKARSRRSRLWRKLLVIGAWIGFIVLSLTYFSPLMDTKGRWLPVLLRSVIVLTAWYFILSPLLMKGLRHFLRKKEMGYGNDLQNALLLFPQLKAYAVRCWVVSGDLKGFRRGWYFLVTMMVFTLVCDVSSNHPVCSVDQPVEATDTVDVIGA